MRGDSGKDASPLDNVVQSKVQYLLLPGPMGRATSSLKAE
jgi:hypothetical protein